MIMSKSVAVCDGAEDSAASREESIASPVKADMVSRFEKDIIRAASLRENLCRVKSSAVVQPFPQPIEREDAILKWSLAYEQAQAEPRDGCGWG